MPKFYYKLFIFFTIALGIFLFAGKAEAQTLSLLDTTCTWQDAGHVTLRFRLEPRPAAVSTIQMVEYYFNNSKPNQYSPTAQYLDNLSHITWVDYLGSAYGLQFISRPQVFVGGILYWSSDTWQVEFCNSSDPNPDPGDPPPATYSLTVNSSGVSGVAITSSNANYAGTTNYSRTGIAYNTTFSLTAPSTSGGRNFSSWTGCSFFSGTTCSVTMTGSQTVTANYVTPTYALTVNSSGASGVSISSSTGHSGTTNYTRTGITSGTNTVLTAPSTSGGQNFSSWTGCSSTSGTTCNRTMDTNRTVTANYSTPIPPQPTGLSSSCNASGTSVTLNWNSASGATSYSLRVDNTTNNTSSCGSGWYCSDPPDKLVNNYTSTTYTTSVTPGNLYNWWVHSVNSSGASSAASASFTCNPSTYTLTVNSSGASGVAITGSNSTYSGTTNYSKTGIANNTSFSLTAPATSGGQNFSSWSGCNSVSSRTCNITMTAGRTVTANYSTPSTYSFSRTPSSLTYSATQNGPVPSSKTVTVTNTGNQTLNFTASDNQSWMSISPTTFSLSPGTNRVVTVSISTTALSPSTYNGTVTFSAPNVSNQTTSVAYSVSSLPTVNVSLSASPNAGTSSINSTLSASVSGTATGTINYSFWWNCTSTSNSVSTTSGSCGSLPSPASGSCASSSVGYKCNAVTTTNPSGVTHTYSTGSYTAKVIVERGSAVPDQATTGINVSTASTYTLTVNSSGASGVAITGSNSTYSGTTNYSKTGIANNTSFSLTAPSTSGGQDFSSWTGCNSVSGTTCSVTITAARTVTASYTAPTLFVDLTAATDSSTWQNSLSGSAPLNGIDLRAVVTGTATETMNYTFYCNRSDSGTNITLGWDAKFDSVNNNPEIVNDLCNYSSPGTYTAKVIVERGTAPPAEERVTITLTNTPPTASNVTVAQPNYCFEGNPGPRKNSYRISWSYGDADGNPQSAYQVQLLTSGGTIVYDSGKKTSSATSHFPDIGSGFLNYGTTYSARVWVWDSLNAQSSPTNSPSWTTPAHAYPDVDFSWSPFNPSVNQTVQFTDETVFSDGSSDPLRTWSWTFGDGGISGLKNPTHTYGTESIFNVILTVTDASNFQCNSGIKPVDVSGTIPIWTEVAPKE
ncbi:MAG: PKD domain-containing protein [bacterium]|nr:PKD domain-containing protein [bacterium]